MGHPNCRRMPTARYRCSNFLHYDNAAGYHNLIQGNIVHMTTKHHPAAARERAGDYRWQLHHH
jgi:hypothetical protein